MNNVATEIFDNAEQFRFEIHVDGEQAGVCEYVSRGGLTAFTHTRTDPAFQGQGLAGKLVRQALDASREAGAEVLPFCDYVSAWINRHPEYLDLVPEDQRARFDL